MSLVEKLFKNERQALIAGGVAATIGFGALLLGFKAKERRNTIIQSLKELKKELFPLLSEIAAASSDESTPADTNPYRKTYQERIEQIFENVLKAHGLDAKTFGELCTVKYKRHCNIVDRYNNLMKSIEHAFHKISPEISCKIPHHLSPEAALELQARVHKSVLQQLQQEVSTFRNQRKSTTLDSARFANIYYKTLWAYDVKKQAYVEQDLDELEVSADQIRLNAIETYKKDDSFREDLEELEEQKERAIQALLLGDRDATIFIESIGSNLGHLNKSSVKCC